jgi:hypothetical protein
MSIDDRYVNLTGDTMTGNLNVTQVVATEAAPVNLPDEDEGRMDDGEDYDEDEDGADDSE